MTNSVAGDPWILDTAATIETQGTILVVDKMIWYPNATNDDLIVHDGAANVKWVVRATAGAPNNESFGAEKFEGPEDFDGFIVATIDGGTLYVYARKEI
jgi:hypothetical protein